MQDHRLTERLTVYWNNLRRDDEIPDFSHFNASTIGDVWQQCVLFTVLPAAPGKRQSISFYKVGDNLRSLYGDDILGRTFVPSQQRFQGASIVSKIDTVLENPVPLVDAGQFISEKNKIIKYRSCLLPFGHKGTVTHVLAGLSWKEF